MSSGLKINEEPHVIADQYANALHSIITQLQHSNFNNTNLARVKRLYGIFVRDSPDAPITLTGPFIRMFQEDILARREQALFEFPYDKYIFEDCADDTKEFIVKLIALIKGTWAEWCKNGDETNKAGFRKHIAELLIYAIAYGCPVQQVFKYEAVKDRIPDKEYGF